MQRMRPEDDLMQMLGGQDPMAVNAMPIPPEMGMPGMGPEMPPEMGMMPEMGMPGMPEMDPMMENMAAPDLPEEATVESVEGDVAILMAENGQRLEVPLAAFPIEPREGMRLFQATVADKTDQGIVVMVAGEQIEIPNSQLQEEFEIGDYFWMPEPPKSADKLR